MRNDADNAQLCANIFEYLQIFANICKYMQIYADMLVCCLLDLQVGDDCAN